MRIRVHTPFAGPEPHLTRRPGSLAHVMRVYACAEHDGKIKTYTHSLRSLLLVSTLACCLNKPPACAANLPQALNRHVVLIFVALISRARGGCVFGAIASIACVSVTRGLFS